MLKGIYSFKQLDLDIAQAYIAIVLDYHSQYQAAERVLDFYKYVSSNEDEVTLIREKKYLEYLVLAKKLKKSFLATVISDMYNNKVLPNGRTRSNALAQKVSLLDLNVNLSEKEIYNDVMILQTSSEHILIHYMRTHTFFVQFKRWLKRTYPKDKFNNPNNFTDAKCKELLNPVIERSRKYFIKNFNKSAIGLNDYIFGALNMYYKDSADDNGKFDKESEVSRFFEIMNSKGQDREISGSDADSSTTALNFIGIDPHLRPAEINFREIAIKICEASKVLYTHKSGKLAFYDIFSRYRDLKFLSDEKVKLAVNTLRGCSVSTYEASDDFNMQKTASSGSFKSKFNKREQYLQIFDKILVSGGASMKDIKTIYDNQISVSIGIPKREQNCIYKVEGGNVKGNFKNSERFKILYDGFIALKDFINFINSSDNTFGITLYNFNTEAFRKLSLAKSITDLESYVKYGDVTSQLIEEQSTSYDHVLLKSNSEVQEELEKLRSIDMFALLEKTSLNAIEGIRAEQKKEEENKKMFNNRIHSFINKMKSFNPGIPFIPEEYECPSNYVCDYINYGGSNVDRKAMEETIPNMAALYKSYDHFNLDENFQFITISKYLSAIECLMALDGVPMLNREGLFDYEDPNYILDYLQEDDLAKSYVSSFNGISIYTFDSGLRESFINKIFDTFFPEQECDLAKETTNGTEARTCALNETSSKSTTEVRTCALAQKLPYWQKLRILFSINNFLICFLRTMSQVGRILERYTEDPVSVYISLCDYLDVLNVDLDKISPARLYKLYNYTRLIYQTGSSINVYQASKFRKEFEDSVKRYFITLFHSEENKSHYKLLQQMKTEMYETFKPNGCLQDVDLEKRKRLRKIAHTLDSRNISYVNQEHEKFFCNEELLYLFKSCAEFNEDGFAVQNGNLFETNSGKFLHCTGASVKPDILGIEDTIAPITKNDISEYELFSNGRR